MCSSNHAKRSLLIAAFTLAVASASTFAFALPGPTACLLVEATDLHALPNGLLTDSGSEADQQAYVQLARDARARIEGTFGASALWFTHRLMQNCDDDAFVTENARIHRLDKPLIGSSEKRLLQTSFRFQ